MCNITVILVVAAPPKDAKHKPNANPRFILKLLLGSYSAQSIQAKKSCWLRGHSWHEVEFNKPF